MGESGDILSPRLARLATELQSGKDRSTDPFWRGIEACGSPLVEPIEGDAQHVLLTLLWRDLDGVANVVVVGGFAGADIANNQMDRLGDTDVWYLTRKVRGDLRTTYQIAPDDPLTPFEEVSTWEDWLGRTAHWRPDPLNPHVLVHPKDDQDPNSVERAESVIELPAAQRHPWAEPRTEVPSGKVEFHRIPSEIMGDEYLVWVYTPPGYTIEGEPDDLLILFDGRDHLQLIPAPTTLDNLLFDGYIRPTIAVMIESPNPDTRMRDLACRPPFLEFLTDELVPRVRSSYRVTSEPRRTTVSGVSLGGLFALFAAFERPDVFGNALSQSGSLWWKPEGAPEPEWLTRRFLASWRLPLRIYMDVGSMEPDSQLSTNRRLRDVLRARSYPVRYVEYSGGHDYVSWRGLLGDGLIWLSGRGEPDAGDAQG